MGRWELICSHFFAICVKNVEVCAKSIENELVLDYNYNILKTPDISL